jgi:hypothetical protein
MTYLAFLNVARFCPYRFRQNAKDAADCIPHGTLYYRSWLPIA